MLYCRNFLTGFSASCPPRECPTPPQGCRVLVSKDKKGCPTCYGYMCGTSLCGPLPCDTACTHGYDQYAMSCHGCECRKPCQIKPCESECDRGYKADRDVCPTCVCKLRSQWDLWLKCQEELCPRTCKCQPECVHDQPLPDNPPFIPCEKRI